MSARRWFATLLALVVALSLGTTGATAQESQQGQQQQQEQQQRQGARQQATSVEEVVIVTASRTQELMLESPTAVSVIDSADIALSPAQNYADLLRQVPGLNVTQTSARDVNMSARAATGTLDASQLVMIDGRSVYQDFFGFVAWDLLPLDFSEIEQIEVTRGPGSAVWGANALNGVVNIITKSPSSYGNAFRVRAGGGERGTGYGSFTWSGVHDKVGFRLTGGYYTQEAWDRPGPLPNGISRGNFPNFGTEQPKFDARVDVNVSDDAFWGVQAGYAGTGGVIHTGIGPFTIDEGTSFSYVRADYNWRQLNTRAYVNILRGDAINLLNGLPFTFDSETYVFEATNTTTIGQHAATYGGTYRTINFDLSIAPGEDNRSEGGGFVHLDLNLNDYVSVDAGVRGDKFSVLDDVVWSPRGAILIRPTGEGNHVFRASFGRAFRAPSLINNFLNVTIFNAVQLPFVGQFIFPSVAVGNQNLKEQQLDQWEIGYRGSVLDGRLSWDLAFYRTETEDNIDFFPSAVYTAFSPPPGWPLPPFLLPPFGPVLLPSQFSYRNIGKIINKGVELGLRFEPFARNTIVANYSYQQAPDVTGISADEVNRPPQNRFNIGWNGWQDNWYYGASVNWVDEAYWTDVLDSRFWGYTDSYTMVNASLGYMFMDGLGEVSVRVTNLANDKILQHIFGDVIERRAVAEVSLTIR